MTEEFLKKFNQAIENKSETEFFKLATKICRKYAYYYSHLNKNITEDWELTTDESVLKILELVKNDNWSQSKGAIIELKRALASEQKMFFSLKDL